MKKILLNLFLVGLFMDNGYPEMIYQFNKKRFSRSLKDLVKSAI